MVRTTRAEKEANGKVMDNKSRRINKASSASFIWTISSFVTGCKTSARSVE